MHLYATSETEIRAVPFQFLLEVRNSRVPINEQELQGGHFGEVFQVLCIKLSAGSGEISRVERTSTTSASSLSRLIIAPIRPRRTPNLLRTSLYSARISSQISHVKVSFSSQSRRNLALGFWIGLPDLNPAIPATSTDVSITPLGRSLGTANRYLRQSFLSGTISANRLCDLRFGYSRQVARCRFQLPREFSLPP